jgi:hypothetical protein
VIYIRPSKESALSIICESFPHASLEGVCHTFWGFTDTLLGEYLVDVTNISLRLEARLEGRLDLLV